MKNKIKKVEIDFTPEIWEMIREAKKGTDFSTSDIVNMIIKSFFSKKQQERKTRY